jgi:hypothetical protein
MNFYGCFWVFSELKEQCKIKDAKGQLNIGCCELRNSEAEPESEEAASLWWSRSRKEMWLRSQLDTSPHFDQKKIQINH